MDEVEKHCQVLGIDEACTQAELEEAYRERAQAWDPEKFAGNSTLQHKAREKLSHIHAAHDFLLIKFFQPATTAMPAASVEPAPVEAPPSTKAESDWEPEPIASAPRKRTAFFVTVSILLFLVFCAALLLIWGTDW